MQNKLLYFLILLHLLEPAGPVLPVLPWYFRILTPKTCGAKTSFCSARKRKNRKSILVNVPGNLSALGRESTARGIRSSSSSSHGARRHVHMWQQIPLPPAQLGINLDTSSCLAVWLSACLTVGVHGIFLHSILVYANIFTRSPHKLHRSLRTQWLCGWVCAGGEGGRAVSDIKLDRI